jgi:hypothetical protein
MHPKVAAELKKRHDIIQQRVARGTLVLSGASEGAKKGWETRGGSRLPEDESLGLDKNGVHIPKVPYGPYNAVRAQRATSANTAETHGVADAYHFQRARHEKWGRLSKAHEAASFAHRAAHFKPTPANSRRAQRLSAAANALEQRAPSDD